MTFGERLKMYRELNSMTQEQLAKSIGVAKSTITGYEKGNREPDVIKIKKIANILKISGDELLGTDFKDEKLSAFEHSIITKYRALDEHGKKMADIVIDEETNRMEKEKADAEKLRIANLKKGKNFTDNLEIDEELEFKRTIQISTLKASAGTGQLLDAEEFELIEVGLEVPLNATFGVRISGDSMEPDYPDGHIAWVRRTPTVEQGRVGIFGYDGEGYIKLLRQNHLISLNPEYEPIEIEDYDRFYVYGEVVGVTEDVY